MTNVEKSFRIWKKGETDDYRATYTISVGKHSICHKLIIEDAMESLKEYLEEME